MENVLVVAKTLYQEYFNKFHKKMDEMKMHKLMYFIQRESLMYNNDILFNEDFLGWKFGPVLLSIRNEYKKLYPFNDINGTVSDNAKKIIDSVLTRYGSLSSWKLSTLSHDEFSWKRSRDNLKASDNGNVKLNIIAMKIDAIKELSYRKDGN